MNLLRPSTQQSLNLQSKVSRCVLSWAMSLSLRHRRGPEQANPCLQALLDAGAKLKGRTHMDELAYSLNGENTHYGTPRNPAAPDSIPGGSSSGSAVAVSGGDVDFAVGSDTGGKP